MDAITSIGPRVMRGDITKVDNGIIAHQVNCQRVASAGLAKSIAEAFPGWKENYQKTQPGLGKVGLYPTDKGVVIADLYGQDRYGTDRQHTDYAALATCFRTLRELSIQTGKQVHVPYGIGCGLGGGTWTEVYELLRVNIPEVIVVKKN